MVIKARKQPQRTCVGCREVKPKKELIRIVRSPEGRVFVDPSGKANGRGAYICASTECLELALGKTRLVSALEITVDDAVSDELKTDLTGYIKRKRSLA